MHHILRRVALDDEYLADIVLTQVSLHRELFVKVNIHRADVRHRRGERLLRNRCPLPAANRKTQKVGDIDNIDFIFELRQQGKFLPQRVLVTWNEFYRNTLHSSPPKIIGQKMRKYH